MRQLTDKETGNAPNIPQPRTYAAPVASAHLVPKIFPRSVARRRAVIARRGSAVAW